MVTRCAGGSDAAQGGGDPGQRQGKTSRHQRHQNRGMDAQTGQATGLHIQLKATDRRGNHPELAQAFGRACAGFVPSGFQGTEGSRFRLDACGAHLYTPAAMAR